MNPHNVPMMIPASFPESGNKYEPCACSPKDPLTFKFELLPREGKRMKKKLSFQCSNQSIIVNNIST